MELPTEDDVDEATGRLEFLLATRIRYELHQRAPVHPPVSEPEAEAGPADPEQDLRAAEFLLATRTQREVNERAIRHEAPDAPPR